MNNAPIVTRTQSPIKEHRETECGPTWRKPSSPLLVLVVVLVVVVESDGPLPHREFDDEDDDDNDDDWGTREQWHTPLDRARRGLYTPASR